MAMQTQKRLATELVDEPLKITPLGAGNEVGRSCLILKYKGKTIMLDCGIHPAHKGIAALPYFDEIDPSTIDIILITHFHLDHAAALPYFLAKTDFKGKVFMTHPTKSIYQLILQDYVRVSAISNPDPLYDEIDLNNSMERIESINFHQTVNCNGIKFWAYNAGHVLGAAMFMIEIAGVKILYTGDYSRKDDRHLAGAEVPETKPDLLVIESTYGIQRLEPIEVREKRFTSMVETILTRGGRCLIPVFALGRAQELLLILDDHWKKTPSLQSYPIFYSSSLAKKCMAVYQTYINMMNPRVQKEFETRNPFQFSHVSYLKGMEDFHDVGPSVVFASPGMLQNGFSRQLFELWCSDERNGVIIPGYIVEGTMAKNIIFEPEKIECMSGGQLPLKMSVHYVTFSAHADYAETSDFIDILKPPHIILVHGDSNEMGRLNNALTIKLKDEKTQISTPKNCQTVELKFGTEKVAKVVGNIASKKGNKGDVIDGVLVLKEYSLSIMEKKELPNFTPLVISSIYQSLKIHFTLSNECLTELISQIFTVKIDQENSEMENSESSTENQKVFRITVGNNVKVCRHMGQNFALVEWMAGPIADAIADSTVALLVSAENLPNKAIAKLVEKSKGPSIKEPKGHNVKVVVKEKHTDRLNDKYSGSDRILFLKTKKILRSVFGSNMIHDKSSGKIFIEIDHCFAGDGRVEVVKDNVNGEKNEEIDSISPKEMEKTGTRVEIGTNLEVINGPEELRREVESLVASCKESFGKIDFPRESLELEDLKREGVV